jgi:hypothetical protein
VVFQIAVNYRSSYAWEGPGVTNLLLPRDIVIGKSCDSNLSAAVFFYWSVAFGRIDAAALGGVCRPGGVIFGM